MKIAYLTSLYARASDTFVREEVRRLRGRGLEISTFSIRKPDESEVVSADIREERATTTYLLPDNAAGLPLALFLCALSSPARFLRGLALMWKTGCPGIRGRIWDLAYLAEGAFLARALQKRGITHLHNHLGDSPATVAMLAAELGGFPFSLSIHGPYIFRATDRWALSEKFQRAAFVACIAHFCKSQVQMLTPWKDWGRLKQVRLAPAPRYWEAPPSSPPDGNRLVWVGRICEEKGVPILLEAVARLAHDGLDFGVDLYGDGPLRGELEAWVRERDLGDRVVFHGWASSDDVCAGIAASRALVCPSFAEGLPTVILEAMALGRPVIATYIAGAPEVVENDVTGWIVPPGSARDLARAMAACLASPLVQLEQLGRAGRRRIEELHHPDVQIDRLADLFRGASKG